MIKKITTLALSAPFVFAQYTNCDMKNPDYEKICIKAVKKGVSVDYANRFLLSPKRTKHLDLKSWKYLQPSKSSFHRKKEKEANNALISFVPKIIKHLQQYQDVYDAVEKKYHVNREIIAAILAKETRLGTYKPSHEAFSVFNTMLLKSPAKTSREKWLKHLAISNMVAILNHCYKAHKEPNECYLSSSYAGAVGYPQFMPSSFNYTVAYDGGVADLMKMEDAIFSIANFLHKKAKFTQLLDYNKIKDIAKIEKAWYHYEFTHKHASFAYEKTRSGRPYNCFTRNKPELSYLKSYVKKVMRYNSSSNYALGVIRLAYEAHKGLNK